ncbi:MAG TPA: hypothetical protein VFM34_00155 [Moraxellaceae bacterium]|nr:hypothetical protein [Moraxellaceae bacterium]
MGIQPDPQRVKELRKEHGVYTAIAMAKKEAREQAIVRLRGLIFDLSPGSRDFTTDLHDVLDAITDLLED